MPEQTPPLRWQAYEHEHIERGRDWFWALGIVAVCAALISALFGNMLFGVLILIAAATLALLARVEPALVEFELSEEGVRVGEDLHRYEEVIAFWVEEKGRQPMLLVDTVKWLSPNLVIPIEGVEPRAVRAFLAERVEEVPMKESIAHKILEVFGL